MMRRFVSRASSGPMSPLSSPSGAMTSGFSATRDKVSSPKVKRTKAPASPTLSSPRTPRNSSTAGGTPSTPNTPAQHKKLLAKLLSPQKSNTNCPLVGYSDSGLTSPLMASPSPPIRNTVQSANQTEAVLENFIQGFKKAVPPSDKATNVRIAQFEDKEFLFVAEPSTQAPVVEEAAAVVTLNSIIAEDLDLKLPPSLLLDGTETEVEAEVLLEAREKEVMIKTDMTRQLKARGFETEEIVEALNTLDARLEAATNVESKVGTSVDKSGKMADLALPAVDEFSATREAYRKEQSDATPVESAEEPQQPVDADLQAEVEKLQEDYNKIFQAEQPRLFMNFLQRGSFEKERNNADRRLISSCNFLDRMAMEEAAEQQAATQAQMELQQQAEVASNSKKNTKKSTKAAKSNHQTALVGAVETEEVAQEVTTVVDTDHLGLAETAMKFYVNAGKSVTLEKSAGSKEDASSSVEISSKKKLAAHQAGISLVALGVRMSDAKASPENKPRVVSSHAYIVEGTRVGAMKKRANDLYHPLLLSTVSSPGASSDAEGSA